MSELVDNISSESSVFSNYPSDEDFIQEDIWPYTKL